MDNFTIVIQADDGAGPDFWVGNARAGDADKFAKWVHKTTGAAVNVFDHKREKSRLTLGSFHEDRT